MKSFSLQCKLMGSAFELRVVNQNKSDADELLQLGVQEIKRIENLLSEFLPDSQTSVINNKASLAPLQIDQECFELINRSQRISILTRGCFDISVSPLKKIYSFKNIDFQLPDSLLIQDTLANIGFQKIELNSITNSIFFKTKEMKISFSAIGKGYASDQVKKLWMKEGVESGFINASGDLNAFGSRPDGSGWKIGIAHPDNQHKIILYVPVQNASVATSGDYEQYFIHNNIRYSHTINPFTGLPVTGIKSVSVFSPGAELSDALATAIYVMGVKEGLIFANQLPDTHCIIIDGSNKIHFSEKLNYETLST